MELGGVEIYSVEMGRFWLDGGSVFGVVPKTIWSRYHSADEENRIEIAVRSLLIKTDNRRILVDTGIGDNFPPKYKNIYKIDLKSAEPKRSLAALGMSPEDITDVIVTHLHFDHIGGAFTNAYNSPEPVYPNARYYVQANQWEWGLQPSDKDRGSYKKDFFEALKDLHELHLVNGEWEMDSVIRIKVFNGHTPGMQLPVVSSEGKTIFFTGDLIPVMTQTAVPFIMGFDVNPLVTVDEKKTILETAVREQWVLFSQHDIKIEAGYVEKVSKHYRISETLSLNAN